ncbi:MAG: anaerobic ribonucleoside-triphosphate reductase activating protein [Pelovirga sp.]
MKPLRIKGFQGTSLLDFPGRIAALVFTGGCNLSCPFCHNGGLVLDPDSYPDIPLDELLADLEQRKNFIDGVVVSGGEPTIDAGLPAFLSELKARRFQVKLDTNGLYPAIIARLLDEGLVDYVAVDLKTSLSRYPELHQAPVDATGLVETVALLRAAAVEVEYRTTCLPGLVTAGEIDAIGELLEGARLWVLQQYIPRHAMDETWQQMEPYPRQTLIEFADRAGRYAEQIQLRGI